MRVYGGAGDTVFRLNAWAIGAAVVLLAALMSSGTIAAQEHIPRGQPIPQSIRWTNTTPSGVGTRASASWSYGGFTSHHNFPVNVSSSTLGKLAGAAVRRGLPVVGWGLVLKDLVNGAGWAIDELQQQVVIPGYDAEPLGVEAWCISFGPPFSQSGMRCTSSRSDVGAMFGRVTGFTVAGQSSVSQYGERVDFYWPGLTYTNAVVASRVIQNSPADWPAGTNGNPSMGTVPVPWADLGNALKDSPEVVNAILIDPETGAPIRTQELVDALNNLRRALESANGVETPGVDLSPSEDFSQLQPNQDAWPAFCDWATPVCDFIDWFKGDDGDVKELPETQLELDPDSWDSGIGEGACPAPIDVAFTWNNQPGSVTFDYDPMCQFATTMRPFLITCAVICAAFIVAGLRSAGSKS